MEMADAIVITKADGTNNDKAKLARAEYARALHLFPPTESDWIPQVLTCSSTEKKGIQEIYRTIEQYKEHTTLSGFFNAKRIQQNKQWLHQTIHDALLEQFYGDKTIQQEIKNIEQELNTNHINPHRAAIDLLKKLKS